jgi:hypothetical protein
MEILHKLFLIHGRKRLKMFWLETNLSQIHGPFIHHQLVA